jgi:hypothetical protein
MIMLVFRSANFAHQLSLSAFDQYLRVFLA